MNPDVIEAQMNPLEHYLYFGSIEQRAPTGSSRYIGTKTNSSIRFVTGRLPHRTADPICYVGSGARKFSWPWSRISDQVVGTVW